MRISTIFPFFIYREEKLLLVGVKGAAFDAMAVHGNWVKVDLAFVQTFRSFTTTDTASDYTMTAAYSPLS